MSMLRNWRLKAGIQKAISMTPKPQVLNRIFQKITKYDLTPAYFESKIEIAERHLQNFRDQNGRAPRSVLEVGTGWFPVVPVALALSSDATTVTTCDLEELHISDQIRKTLDLFVQTGRDRNGICAVALEMPADTNSAELLAAVGVELRCQDLSDANPIDDERFEMFMSTSTLEHIPSTSLVPVLEGARRLCTEDAVLSQLIDLSDHYSGFDESIGTQNFLQFSERAWAKYNNGLHFQNRLRLPQYLAALETAGWNSENVDSLHDDTALDGLEVHPDFEDYDELVLSVQNSWITGKVVRGPNPMVSDSQRA